MTTPASSPLTDFIEAVELHLVTGVNDHARMVDEGDRVVVLVDVDRTRDVLRLTARTIGFDEIASVELDAAQRQQAAADLERRLLARSAQRA